MSNYTFVKVKDNEPINWEEIIRDSKIIDINVEEEGDFQLQLPNKKEYIISFDWDEMYDSIEYYYEPAKITADPDYSSPAEEGFDWTFDYTMLTRVSEYDEQDDEFYSLDITDEDKKQIINFIKKYKSDIIQSLDESLYDEYKWREPERIQEKLDAEEEARELYYEMQREER